MTDTYTKPDPDDLHYNHAPVCPYCGYEMGDAWELGLLGDGDAEVQCGRCEGWYHVSAHVSVTYSTRARTHETEMPKQD